MQTTALLLALSALLVPIGTAAAQQKPNVIFIVCDDLNTHVSTSGYPHVRTPSFTRLAESGMAKPGSKATGLVEMVDFFPTLAELCGVPPPENLQGKSLVPMLKDAAAPGKDVAYTVVARQLILQPGFQTNNLPDS